MEVCAGLLADVVLSNTRSFGDVVGELHERVEKYRFARAPRWRREVLLEGDDDDDGCRRERLNKVADLLLHTSPGCYKIRNLYDDEGHLTVTWGILPTERERSAVEWAWNKQNEPCGLHEFPDGSEMEWRAQ